MAVTADNVQKAYLAYFGRPADPVGLAYWQTQDAATMKAGFAASAEYTALYANMSTTQMVSQVYTNLLGRAADVTGLLYWAGEITAGRQTVSTLVDAMQTNALGDDILTISNRVTYATAFTAALDTVTEINGYSGTSAATAARTAVSSVLHTDASLTTATTALATSVTTVTAAGTAAAVTTYTLTSDAPSITEGDSGTKSLTFTLTLDKAPTEAITVNYQTLTTGTAASGDDFTAAASTVTFAVGQTTATVTVSAVGDTTFEANETVAVKFSGTKLAADVTATGTITNNDVDTVNAAQTFTLTTAADSGSSVTGGSGDDTFNAAYIGDLGTGTTFNPGDALVGGSGTDTLNVSISGTITTGTAETVAAFTLSGVEKVLVANFDTQEGNAADDHLFNMSGATGVTTVGLSSSSTTGDTTFNNLKNVVDAEMKNGGGDLSVKYLSTLLTGTSDSVNLTVDAVGTDTTSADFETYAVATTGVAETLAITSSNTDSYITLNGNNDHETINVGGNAALAITNVLDTTVTAITSTNTAGLTVTLGTSDIAFTGGAGNDVVNAVATITAADTLAGGSGTDTLTVSDSATIDTAAEVANISGFEVLEATTNDDAAFDASLISGLTKLVSSAVTDANNVTFSNITSTVTDIQVTGTEGVIGTLKTNTSADSVTLTYGSSTAGVTVAGQTTLVDYETINIVSQGGANNTGAFSATSATTLNITGSKSLTMGTLTGNTLISKVDASGMTGTATLTMNATNGSTTAGAYTGTANADFLVGGTKADTISGGAGNDTVTAGSGADSIVGGAGADSIDAGAGTDIISGGADNDTLYVQSGHFGSGETMDGGSGTDTISFAAADVSLLAADLLGLKSVEKISVAATTNATTITLTDAVFTANGNATLTLDVSTVTTGNVTVAASGLTAANSLVVIAAENAEAHTDDSIVLGAGNDTVRTGNDVLDDAMTITGGSGTDTLEISDAVNAVATRVSLATSAITGFEKFTFRTATNDYALLLEAGNVASGATLTVDASNLTSGKLNFSGSSVAATGSLLVTGGGAADSLIGGIGNDTISGGSGADSLQGGSGVDSITAGDGNDVVEITASGEFVSLAAAEAIDGGAGDDTLTFSGAGAYAINSSDLANVKNMETVSFTTSSTSSIVVTDSLFTNIGVSTLTLSDSQVTAALTVNAAAVTVATSALDITTGNNANDTLLGGAGNDTFRVTQFTSGGTTAVFDASDSINGGAGTDTLEITLVDSDGDATAPVVATAITLDGDISNIEVITITSGSAANDAEEGLVLTLNDSEFVSLTAAKINASGVLSTSAVRIVASSEDDSTISITGGAGADTLVGGTKVDTISGGSGADSIMGGSGADNLTGGAGADTFVYTAVAQSGGSNVDSITDFTSGTDKLQFTLDYSGTTSGITVDATVQTAAAGVTAVQTALSGNRGQIIYDTDNSKMYVNNNADNLITSLDYSVSVNAASTAASTIADGDVNLSITGGTGADSIVAGGGADTITGNTGQDTITSGAGADSIIIGTGSATGTVGGSSFNGTITGFDIVTDLTTGTTAAAKDLIDFQVAPVAVAVNGAVDGTDGTLVVGGTGTNVVITHTQATATGLASFFKTGATALTIASDADLAAVVQYLNLNDLGNAGATIVFQATYTTATRGSTTHSFIYQQTTTDAGGTGGHQLVDVVGVSLAAWETTASTTNLYVYVA